MIIMSNLRLLLVQFLYALWLGLFLLWFPGVLSAQVDTSELGKGQGQVEFQNYTGPVGRVDTRDQIRSIGSPLGTAVKSGAARSGSENRYFVIHAVSDPDGNRLDADIFGLGPGVGVDHIRNLRLIIQGYLEGAYNYSAQDASLLAEYITIYNAVFRGDWNYFNTGYKKAVLQYLTPEKVGLSTRFSEWPGRTLMVIPLGNSSAGSLSAIDTASLSDRKVIDEMSKDEDGGVDRRTAMADLKDREADEAEEAARRQREAIAAEEARIAAERAALEAERERLARERDALSAKELAEREAEAERLARELAEREAALAAEREAAQRAEDFANQKRAEAEADRRDIAGEDQADAGADQGSGAGDQAGGTDDQAGGAGDQGGGTDDQAGGAGDQGGGTDDQQAGGAGDQAGDTGDQDGGAGDQDGGAGDQGGGDQAGGAEDQRDRDQDGGEGSQDDGAEDTSGQDTQGGGDGDQAGGFIVSEDGRDLGIVGMDIAVRDSAVGYIVKVHPSTGAELQRSTVNTINIRTVQFINNKILALAGQNQTGGTMRLVEIDMNSLEVTNQGTDDIPGESLLWVKDNNLYAIVSSGGNRYLARFDTNLILQAQSAVPVHPYAAVTFQGDMLLLTQRDNGRALLLDPIDLTEGR